MCANRYVCKGICAKLRAKRQVCKGNVCKVMVCKVMVCKAMCAKLCCAKLCVQKLEEGPRARRRVERTAMGGWGVCERVRCARGWEDEAGGWWMGGEAGGSTPQGWFIISGVRLHWPLLPGCSCHVGAAPPGSCGYCDPYIGMCCDDGMCCDAPGRPTYAEIDDGGWCDGGSGWEGGSEGAGGQLPYDIAFSPIGGGAGDNAFFGGETPRAASFTMACDRNLSVCRPKGSSSSSCSSAAFAPQLYEDIIEGGSTRAMGALSLAVGGGLLEALLTEVGLVHVLIVPNFHWHLSCQIAFVFVVLARHEADNPFSVRCTALEEARGGPVRRAASARRREGPYRGRSRPWAERHP